MQFTTGQTASFSKTITEKDVCLFAEITGDNNPVHIDEAKAAQSRFGRRIVHGALVSSYISTVLGSKLPGEGTIYMSQTSKFIKPVYIGDTITATVEISEINGNKAILKTQVFNQNNDIVVDGEAKVLLPV